MRELWDAGTRLRGHQAKSKMVLPITRLAKELDTAFIDVDGTESREESQTVDYGMPLFCMVLMSASLTSLFQCLMGKCLARYSGGYDS